MKTSSTLIISMLRWVPAAAKTNVSHCSCLTNFNNFANTQILHVCEERDEAYITCREVLSQLNQMIPESIDTRKLIAMIKETGDMLGIMSDDDLLVLTQELEMYRVFTLKFYTLLVSILLAANYCPNTFTDHLPLAPLSFRF